MSKTKAVQWTKNEIRKVKELWNSATVEQIADELSRTKQSVQYIAGQIRKAGFDLPKKRKVKVLQNLIKEVFGE